MSVEIFEKILEHSKIERVVESKKPVMYYQRTAKEYSYLLRDDV